jgi:alpha-beta hydrolase superfamily lysophospholipase
VNVLAEAAKVKVPVLLISGSSDWIVPTDEERKVLAALGTERKSLVVIPNAEHDTTYGTAPELYSKAVLDFLNNNLGR